MISGKAAWVGLCLLAALAGLHAAPATCRWTHVESDHPLPVRQFQFIDGRVGFAHDAACLWQTDDGGRHWRKRLCAEQAGQAGADGPAIDGIQFIDANVGWLLMRDGPLLSTRDAGATSTAQTFAGAAASAGRRRGNALAWAADHLARPGAGHGRRQRRVRVLRLALTSARLRSRR